LSAAPANSVKPDFLAARCVRNFFRSLIMQGSRKNVGSLVSALAMTLLTVPAATVAVAADAPAKAASPCAGGNPCAASKRRSRADNPCSGNPCAGSRKRGAADESNPCAGKSRRRSGGDNPCAGKSR
jgi:hypothetical protein